MKEWETIEIVEVDVAETENGATPQQVFDQQWYDENGKLHISLGTRS